MIHQICNWKFNICAIFINSLINIYNKNVSTSNLYCFSLCSYGAAQLWTTPNFCSGRGWARNVSSFLFINISVLSRKHSRQFQKLTSVSKFTNYNLHWKSININSGYESVAQYIYSSLCSHIILVFNLHRYYQWKC